MSPPLIDRPERLHRNRRTFGRMATGLAWFAYAWLWLPLLTLLAWLLGVRTAWQRLYLEQNALDPFLLAALPVIAVVCGLLLIGWAEYNRARFSDADSRRRRSDVPDEAVDERMGASQAVADTLRRHRVVSVAMDARAKPTTATVLHRDLSSG